MIYNTKKIEEIKKKFIGAGPYKLSKVFHHGSWNMRREGLEFALTYEELQEYSKSYNDIIYFAENHLKITSIATDTYGSDIPLKLYDYQKDMLRNSQDHRFSIFSNPRQSGTSLMVDIMILHTMIFGGKRNIVGTFQNMASSVHHMKNLKWLYRNVPVYMKPGIVTSNNWTFGLDNGSIYNVISQNSNLKGKIVDDLYLNDFGYYRDESASGLIKSLFPAIARGGKIVISNTSDGKETNQTFDKMYNDSLRKPGDPKKNLFRSFKTWPWEAGQDEDATWRGPV